LFAKELNCFFEIAAGFTEGFFALHESESGFLPEFGNRLGADIRHIT
jgi:hypothetical protein